MVLDYAQVDDWLGNANQPYQSLEYKGLIIYLISQSVDWKTIARLEQIERLWHIKIFLIMDTQLTFEEYLALPTIFKQTRTYIWCSWTRGKLSIQFQYAQIGNTEKAVRVHKNTYKENEVFV